MSQRPATSASPRLRLSPRGYLRRCILAGLSASSLVAVPAGAAQFGSPGWFAQQGAAAGVPGGAAPAPMIEITVPLGAGGALVPNIVRTTALPLAAKE